MASFENWLQRIASSNRLFRFIFKFQIVKQFSKFALIGGTSALIDFVIFFSLTGTIPWFAHNILIANAISFMCAFIYNYSLNRKWTFVATDVKVHIEVTKYFITQACGFGINQLILGTSYTISLAFHLSMIEGRFISKFIAGGVVMIFNFVLSRYWVFRK